MATIHDLKIEGEMVDKYFFTLKIMIIEGIVFVAG